jgi:L-lactate dehydrogenase (cytochrome)
MGLGSSRQVVPQGRRDPAPAYRLAPCRQTRSPLAFETDALPVRIGLATQLRPHAESTAMPVITNIDDLKRIYERRVPRMFYDYAESGSWTEQTFRDNSSDFEKIRLRQRVAVDMSGRSTRSTMIGQDVTMPVALSPVGLTGMQHADGEIKAARAAEKVGVPFTLSTMSINSIEEVAEATTAPFWFQLYTMKDTDFVGRLIERARAAGCSALVITLDLQILGQRHKDIKNGLSAPPKLTPKTIANLLTKWSAPSSPDPCACGR